MNPDFHLTRPEQELMGILHRKLERTFESGPTIASVEKLAQQLFQWFSVANAYNGTEVARSCVFVETAIIGWLTPRQSYGAHEFVVALMDRLTWKQAMTLLKTVTDHQTTIAEMKEHFQATGAEKKHSYVTYSGKILLMYTQLYTMSSAITDLVPRPQEWGFTQAEQQRIAEEGAFLAQTLDERREYGVKACFLQDGFFHNPHEAWAFQDGFREHRVKLTHGHLLSDPVATVACSTKDTIFKMAKKRKQLWPPTEEYPARIAFAIQRDGSLSCASSNQTVLLEEIFKLAGREDAYPMFHFVQMLRIYSLIVPETIRREHNVAQLQQLPKDIKARQAYLADLPGVFRRMWLPRTRLETPAPTSSTSAESQTQNSPQEVVGFFRKLPKGHTASEQAKALALQEKGKLPPPGKTYVKERTGGELSLREVRR